MNMNFFQRPALMTARLSQFLLLVIAGGLIAHADTASTFDSQIRPILSTHCVACHSEDTHEADVRLDAFALDPHLWYRVLDQLELGQMPPEGETPLSTVDRDAIMQWIRGSLTQSLAEKRLEEGRSGFRRLSRTEYSNTIEDLFGIRVDVSRLPEDGRVNGFTKVGAALPMSTDGAYGYYEIARELLEKWILVRPPGAEAQSAEARTHRLAAKASNQSKLHSLPLPDGWHVSFNTDGSSGDLVFGKGPTEETSNKFGGARTPGMHKLKAHIYAYQSDKPLTVGIYAGHTAAYPQLTKLVGIIEAPPGEPALVETEVFLGNHPTGVNRIRLVPFGLGVQVIKNTSSKKCKGPGLAIQYVDITTPELPVSGFGWLTSDLTDAFLTELVNSWYLARHNRSRPADITTFRSTSREGFLDMLQKTLARILPRLYRRDVQDTEINELIAEAANRIDAGDDVHEVWLDAIAAAMTSPDFTCVIESSGELSDFELASRLSYFLWNATPDEQLMSVARAQKLRDPATLRQETERLIDDPRSARFIEDFLDQWLELHAIHDTTPNGRLYPEYGDDLKYSSLLETQGFFAIMLERNRSVRDFVAPTWVLANGRLAELYGIENVHGSKLRPVRLPKDSPFGGLWTQPAILKVTADGTSTSPVKRGVWIARRLLGTYISPPPPNIEPINPDTSGATTRRQQLELHSSHGSCAACHVKFDPFGFALESFDVMGQYRTNYRDLDPEIAKLPYYKRKKMKQWIDALPVDSSGVTPDGFEFEDLQGLRQWLASKPEKLAWGVTWNLATYATAEPTGPLDRAAIQEIVDSAKGENYGLRSLVHGLVQSKLFRWK